MEMVPHQENAPLDITSALSSREFLYQDLGVRNTSQYRITSVTFGIAIYPSTTAAATPIIRRGQPIATDLEPGQDAVLKVNLIRPSEVYEAVKPQETSLQPSQLTGSIRTDIGLVEVDSDARPIFIYQPEQHGGFHKMSKARTKSSVEPGGPNGSTVSSAAEVTPLAYFHCEPAEYCTYCENHYTYCITRMCPVYPPLECNRTNCPWTHCQYSP
jgi:hypothetical protein